MIVNRRRAHDAAGRFCDEALVSAAAGAHPGAKVAQFKREEPAGRKRSQRKARRCNFARAGAGADSGGDGGARRGPVKDLEAVKREESIGEEGPLVNLLRAAGGRHDV